jgi:hypothetical protein
VLSIAVVDIAFVDYDALRAVLDVAFSAANISATCATLAPILMLVKMHSNRPTHTAEILGSANVEPEASSEMPTSAATAAQREPFLRNR